MVEDRSCNARCRSYVVWLGTAGAARIPVRRCRRVPDAGAPSLAAHRRVGFARRPRNAARSAGAQRLEGLPRIIPRLPERLSRDDRGHGTFADNDGVAKNEHPDGARRRETFPRDVPHRR